MKTITKFLILISAAILLSTTVTQAQCTAGYTWTQTSNNVITFTNTSSPIIPNSTFFSWYFGDQQYDWQQNPIHTYNVPGTYIACVTMYDSLNQSCTSTFCDTITVTGTIICNMTVGANLYSAASCSTCSDGAAYANVSGGTAPYTYAWSNSATTQTATQLAVGNYTVCVTDANGCYACATVNVPVNSCTAGFTWTQTSNNVIAFTNTSSPIIPNSTFFSWYFGDQQYGWQQDPVHTYSTPGTYLVCVTMYDSLNQSCTSTFCDSVSVFGNVLCNVSVYANVSNPASCSTCADGSAYATMYGGSSPYTYSWSDGQTTQLATGLAPGTYSVCVTDANGCTACDSVTIYFGNSSSCQASFSSSQTQNNIVDFTSTSTGVSASTVYIWNFGDNGYGTGNPVTHTYASAGNYIVCLTIYDSLSSCQSYFCDSVNVTGVVLCNVYLYSGVSQPASCATCADGSAYASMSNGTAPYTYLWSDGQTTQIATGLAPGTYGVCVTDANGCQACDTVTMYFGNQTFLCNANFVIYPDSVNTNIAWIYNLSTGGPNMTYQWFWGDNTPVDTVPYPSHVYSSSGSYNICLVIYDAINQCSDTMCQLLWVPRLSQQAASNPFYVNVIPTGMQENSQSSWSLFPNPASTELTIKTDYNLQGKKYHILDIAGRTVIANTIDGNKIDVNSLDKGMYILQIENSKGGFSAQRFMKD